MLDYGLFISSVDTARMAMSMSSPVWLRLSVRLFPSQRPWTPPLHSHFQRRYDAGDQPVTITVSGIVLVQWGRSCMATVHSLPQRQLVPHPVKRCPWAGAVPQVVPAWLQTAHVHQAPVREPNWGQMLNVWWSPSWQGSLLQVHLELRHPHEAIWGFVLRMISMGVWGTWQSRVILCLPFQELLYWTTPLYDTSLQKRFFQHSNGVWGT